MEGMLTLSTPGLGVPSDAKARTHPRAAEVTTTRPARRVDRQPRGGLRPRPPNRATSEETIPRPRSRQHPARLSHAEESGSCLFPARARGRMGPAAATPHLGGGPDLGRPPRATAQTRPAQPLHAPPLVPRRRTGAGTTAPATPIVVEEGHGASPDLADRCLGTNPLGGRHSGLLVARRRRGHRRRPGDGDFPPEPSGAKSILGRLKTPCASCSHAGACPSP
jgi:hypothetical protein